MGAITIQIPDNTITGESYCYIELTGKYLVSAAVVQHGLPLDFLDFRATVFITSGGHFQDKSVAVLCQGLVGFRSWLGWTGRIPIYEGMTLVCNTRGDTTQNACLGCVVED